MAEPVIEFRQVSLRDGARTIFQDVNLAVQAGEKLLLWGRSGSGKSSLLKMALGLIHPGSGEVRVAGQPLDGRNVWEIRRKIGFVSQEFQFGRGLTREVLRRFGTFKANAGAQFDDEALRDMCRLLELDERLLDKPTEELSGGERQRMAIMLVLLLRRQTLLLDEVTSALDPALKQKVVRFLVDQPDRTILAAAHDDVWLEHAQVRVVKLEELT